MNPDEIKWDAPDYAANSQAQLDWVREAVGKLRLHGSDEVLDTRSGDGKVAAAIARTVSHAPDAGCHSRGPLSAALQGTPTTGVEQVRDLTARPRKLFGRQRVERRGAVAPLGALAFVPGMVLMGTSIAAADPPVRVTPRGRCPLVFEKNTGRYDKRVRFLTRTGRTTIFITQGEMVMVASGRARGERRETSGPALADGGELGASLPRPSALSAWPLARQVLRMRLVGASVNGAATGLEKQPATVNYLIGNDPRKWRTRVPTYARAKITGVYPGIDLIYYGAEARGTARGVRNVARAARSVRLRPLASALEYDFIVKPGADPSRIKLAFEGADRVRLADGDLILSTPAGDVRLRRPYAYQTIGGRRVKVACEYVLRRRTASLRITRHDPARPLVVDPVLEFSTYLGGAGWDFGRAAATDASGAVYVVGETDSTDFPATSGALSTTNNGGMDAFVVKLNASGTALVYTTYVGAAGNDYCDAIVCDGSGAVHIAGMTWSAGFPTTPGAFDTTLGGTMDSYAAKLNASGSALEYSTFLGGSSGDYAEALALCPSGALLVAGYTQSSDFPTTPGAFDTSNVGTDAFVAKLNATGAALEFSTFLGASNVDYAYGIACDSSGSAYVVGGTGSASFPTTPGAFCTAPCGAYDGFAAKLSVDGRSLLYSTYLCGSNADYAYAVAVDSGGRAYVAGYTSSANFPTTAGAYDTTHNGGRDAFVLGLNADGSALVFGTFMGGSGEDYARSVALAPNGALWIAGDTSSSGFPTTGDALSRTCRGGQDAFLARLSPTGGALEYSTFLGGSSGEWGNAVVSDAAGTAIVVGETGSGDFPTTVGAFDRTFGSNRDGFALRISSRTPTETTVASQAGSIGQTVSLEAALRSGGSPLAGRALAFRVAGTSVGDGTTDGSGVATVTYVIPELSPGDHVISASFAGDIVYGPSTGTGALSVQRAGTEVAAQDASGSVGETIALCATLTRLSDGAPVVGRTLDFSVGGTVVGSGATDGDGRATIGYVAPEQVGLSRFIATFAGDAYYDASWGAGALTIAASGTSLYTIDRTGTITENVVLRQYDLKRATDNALLSGKAIVYRIEGSDVGTATTDAGGDSTLTWTITGGPAARTITVEFAGDVAYNPSSDDAALTCQTWTTKMATFDRTVRLSDRTELKARLLRSDNVPLYGKGISFSVDGTFVVTRNTDVDGYAKWPVYYVPDGAGAGTRTILAEWPGNGGYAAIIKTATLTVLKAIPYIWVLPKTIPQGAIANLYAYFRRLYDYQKQAGKTVSFKIDGTWVADVTTGSGAESGVARYLHPTGGLSVGVHTIRCEFAGDAWVEAGYGEGTLTIQ